MDSCRDLWILLLCIAQTLFTLVPLTLHIAGIHILHKYSTYPTQQRQYLTQISIFEIIFLLLNNNCLVYLELYQFLPQLAELLQLFIKSSVAIPWCIIMIFLTLDRIAQVWLHVKYERYITSFRTRLLIIGAWTIGITLFVSMSIVRHVCNIDSTKIVHFYITQVFMGLVFVIIIPCYIYICIKMRTNKKRDRKRSHCRPESQKSMKKLIFVPFWIVFTYVFTILFPNIMQVVFKEIRYEVTCYFYILAQFLFSFGWIADALIYILMDKRSRKRFLAEIGWKRKEEDCEGKVIDKTRVNRSETLVTTPVVSASSDCGEHEQCPSLDSQYQGS